MPEVRTPATVTLGSFPVALGAKADPDVGAGWRCSAMPCATAPRLTKGAEVYCDGRLSLGTWTGPIPR
jgi:hypothetical protein